MNKRALIATLLGVAGWPVVGHAAFTGGQKVQLIASVTLGNPVASPLVISATALNSQVFFGKDLVIAIDVTNVPLAGTTAVDFVYQLVDANGQPLSALVTVPADLKASTTDQTHLTGSVEVDRVSLAPIQNGGSINYFFEARPSGSTAGVALLKTGSRAIPAGTSITASGSDFFSASVINELTDTVVPGGYQISLPDMFQRDGETAFNFPPNAVSAPTSVSVRQIGVNGLPPGPNGLVPVVAYTISSDDGTPLQRAMQVSLSYPADIKSGRVLGSGVDPLLLAPYWLDATQWQLLSVPQTNTTLHTVTGMGSRFSTYALFAVGAVGAADLRPMQRIITPNGDGKNDYADFSSITDDVHLFDMRGRRVRTLTGFGKRWDGTDDSGHVVESGVYLYQYTVNGDRVSGVIMVAK